MEKERIFTSEMQEIYSTTKAAIINKSHSSNEQNVTVVEVEPEPNWNIITRSKSKQNINSKDQSDLPE